MMILKKSIASQGINLYTNKSLGADTTDNFYKLLNIMEGLHNDDVKAIVRDIRRALVTGEDLIIVNPSKHIHVTHSNYVIEIQI